MTCLLSKYPVKYVKKILQKLQKLQKFIIYCRQLLPNAWQYRKPATGSSLRTHGDKKTAIIILFIMMAVTYSILSYTFHLFRRELIIILFPDAFLCISMIFYSLSFTCSFKSTIHVSLHILIIYLNIWYYVQYVYSFFIFIIRFYFLRLFLLLSESPLPAFLSIIIKAYSMGIFNCHTTNILIR